MVGAYTRKMMHRSRRFLAAALMTFVVLPAFAADLDCDKMLAKTAAKNLDQETIRKAQWQLTQLGFDPDGVDGLLGSKTRAALLRFCTSAQFARSDDLLVMLRNHEAIFRGHRDWTTTLASKDFLTWAAKQTDAKQISQTRQYGDSASVIALLDRYANRKDEPQESVPPSWNDDEYPVSYVLTKDDFKQLKTREAVSSRVGKLLGKAYGDKDEFETAAGAALKEVADGEDYVRQAEKYGEQQTSYRITKESLDELKAAGVPDYVLDALKDIQDLDYVGDELQKTVEATLGALAERAMDFKPEIVKLAVITPSGGSLTEGSLAQFADAHQGDLLAAAVLEKLSKLQGVKYRNDKALAEAVKKALDEIGEQIDDSIPAVIDHAQESSAYAFDKQQAREISQKIKDSAVPEIFLVLMGSLQDVDYPDAELFWRATKAKVEMAGDNNIFRKPIWDAIKKLNADKVDQPLLDELKAAKLPPAILDQLATLQGREFGSAKGLEGGINYMLKQLSREYDQFRPLILAQATKRHPFDKAKTIQWSGAGCNCVRSSLEGTVYGLYPYWMADGKQAIDFSVQTRIGYYGLSFDDKGNIANASRWSGLDTGFIREARTYGTKVDLVIYRNDWEGWGQVSRDEKTALFQNLAKNIASLVEIPMTDLFSKVKPYISLGRSPSPVMADGVTLYFAGYPQDEESVQAFNAFVKTLRDRLRAPRRKYFVNIMFRSAEMGKGVYDYNNLLSLRDAGVEEDGKLRSLFLVLLQEPTTVDKKKLRADIENGLHGADRLKLLRNVVTVLTYDGQSADQLADDVIYAKDNFGGIGFWTQPVVSGAKGATDGAALAASVLHKTYLGKVNGGTALKSGICRIVCPNKWLFRFAWDIFVLALLGCIGLYFVACEWRNYLDKHFIHFIAGIVLPTVLLTFALLFCDPYWEDKSKGNGILIFVIAGILAYSIWSYREKKRKADLP